MGQKEQRTTATLEVWYPETIPNPGGIDPENDLYTVDVVKEFRYSSDVLGVGEECLFTIVNQDGKYTGLLKRGSTVRLYLSHPAVNGGAKTLKFKGIITRRAARASDGTIRITVADLGWHLVNCHAPLWQNLRTTTFEQMCDPTVEHSLIDPSWRLVGLRSGKDANRINRFRKLGLPLGRAGALLALDAAKSLTHTIQVEGGESIFDIMVKAAQKKNLLVNVTCDGYVQIWDPDYERKADYKIDAKEGGTNIIEGELVEDIASLWTHLDCVGEYIGILPQDTTFNQNAAHRRGTFPTKGGSTGVLPFVHRRTGADGEMYDDAMADKQAEWWFKRGLFDSLYLQYTVVDHCQYRSDGTAIWWESDQLCDVVDELLGVQGVMYVASVMCESSVPSGDTTQVVLRRPHLLSAAWGEWKAPAIVKSSKKPEQK